MNALIPTFGFPMLIWLVVVIASMLEARDAFSRLSEAIQQDEEQFYGGIAGIKEAAARNPVYKKAMREMKFSDIAYALGGVHWKVWEAAKIGLIGRELVNVIPTTEAMVRFYKQVQGKAWKVGEASPFRTGEKEETLDIYPDDEIAYRAEWTLKYLEDASWNVLERDVVEAGYQIGLLETQDILAMFEAIPVADAAGGALMGLNDGAAFVWDDVVDAYMAVWGEGHIPTDLVLAVDEAKNLMKQVEFLNSMYYAPEEIIRSGISMSKLGTTWLGMSIWVTPLLASAHKLCIAKRDAAALVERRPLVTSPYEDPSRFVAGVAASERIGMDVLRTKAVGIDT